MVHVLIHMGLLGGRETSETIAMMLNTNPVVVRRTMAALKLKGIVDSEGGRGGGWILQIPLNELTILDIHSALEGGPLIGAGTSRDHPTCPVEKVTNSALAAAFDRADSILRDTLAQTTLGQLAQSAVDEHEKLK
jgi:DNA-binding IscR family transcriptional regulator